MLGLLPAPEQCLSRRAGVLVSAYSSHAGGGGEERGQLVPLLFLEQCIYIPPLIWV